MTVRPTLERLDDYLEGALAPGDERQLEEALFDAAAAGTVAELSFLDTLRRVAPWFERRGGFVGGLTRAKLEELRREAHVHYIDLPVDRPVTIPEWPADTNFVVYRIAVDLRGCEDVEVHLSHPDAPSVKVFRGVFYERSDGAIYGLCEEPLARTTFRMLRAHARIEATRDGRRETVATLDMRPA